MSEKNVYKPKGELVAGEISFVNKTVDVPTAIEWVKGSVLTQKNNGKIELFDSSTSVNPPMYVLISDNEVASGKSIRVASKGALRADGLVFSKVGDNLETIFKDLSLDYYMRLSFDLYEPEEFDNLPS